MERPPGSRFLQSGCSALPRSSVTARSITATASSRPRSPRNWPGRSNGCSPCFRSRCWQVLFLRRSPGAWRTGSGATRLMVLGSLAAAAALLLCALAPGRIGFALGVLAMELASCFVLYSTAFVAIVQLGGHGRSITHLTLIAGFASTLFWPLTTVLHEHLGWREVLAIFAALNVGICLPIHWWLARVSRSIANEVGIVPHSRRLGDWAAPWVVADLYPDAGRLCHRRVRAVRDPCPDGSAADDGRDGRGWCFRRQPVWPVAGGEPLRQHAVRPWLVPDMAGARRDRRFGWRSCGAALSPRRRCPAASCSPCCSVSARG